MARFTYKPIKGTSLADKKYTMHKSWTVTDETAGAYGIVSYSGQYSNGEWSISDNNNTNVSNEPQTTDSFYKREIFDSLKHIYYRDPENSFISGDNQYFRQQTRNLHRLIHVVDIPSRIFGDRLREGSVTMSSGKAYLYDDGVGNIRDKNIETLSNFEPFTKDDYYIKLDLNEGYKTQKGNYKTDSTFIENKGIRLLDFSNGPYTAIGRDITFDYHALAMGAGGMYGRSGSSYVTLHGSQSIDEDTNSYIEIDGTVQMSVDRLWNNNWSISTWINVPESQSVTQSFTGNWVNEQTTSNRWQNRPLVDNDYNIIATSQAQSNNRHTPWELQVYNSRTSKKGKIRFLRGFGTDDTTLTEITSSTALNDGNWHHVVIQVATASMQLYIDGTLQASKTDPATNIAIYDQTANILIGGRKWSHKRRYRAASGERGVFFHSKLATNYIHPFKGSVNQFRVFKNYLSSNQITSMKNYYRDSSIVGNVFYNHGMITITDLSGSYNDLIDDYTLNFKSSVERTVHNYKCVVEDGEYNVSLNPSVRKNYDPNSDKLQGIASSSNFSPYITTIGLVDDSNQLLAIGKLAYPVKSPTDIDITFNVQFDT